MTNPHSTKKIFWSISLLLLVIVTVASVYVIIQINGEIRQRLDGRKWALPAIVYARPLELYSGMQLLPDQLVEELQLAGYRNEKGELSAGGYRIKDNEVLLFSRPFIFPDGLETSKALAVSFSNTRITSLQNIISGEMLDSARLDPARIGSFHPLAHEDRIIVEREQIPDLLIQTLIAVEDRDFFSHPGFSPTGIARAIVANIKAGKTVQGGSTLTQQLVKNLFLDRSRTLSRKLKEMVMALLLERQLSKSEILTAYVNEVFLGQDGGRAIHGFALASQFYFRRRLEDLSVAQIAMLVGMVKGPSLYDPRRNETITRQRRKTVLDIMLAENVIDLATYQKAQQQPLTDVAPQENGFNRFPAFLDLVKRQLGEQYRQEDLKTSGLKILTTLDPFVQQKAEKSLEQSIDRLQKQRVTEIEGAMVVTGRQTGEVLAVVGGKRFRQSGFNRALDAERAIGSLVKPAIYLSALENGYSLATALFDTEMKVDNDGKSWQPQNYDRQQHGRVGLYEALSKSYNLATVRLGMTLGVDTVLETLKRLGHNEEVKPYPSILLGAVNMSPFEVAQLYQTIASGGFHQPLRSIQAVLGNDGRLQRRYNLEVEMRFSPETTYLLNHALMRVMSEGTGSSASSSLAQGFAGKTGTTDGLRDSWFAGYSAENLAVVWLGNDDNRSISLSGAKGALQMWTSFMHSVNAQPPLLPEPRGIIWRRIDKRSLQETTLFNQQSIRLPFRTEHADTLPAGTSLKRQLGDMENRARKMIDFIEEQVK